MQDRPLSLPHVFRRVERYFGHKTVVSGRVDGETVMTWAEVCARARRLAASLDHLGLPADARVGTFAWNSHRHVELYLAVPCTGRVLHTINHRLFGEQITYIVNDAADDALFIDRSILPVIWPLVDAFTTVRAVVVMDDGSDAEIPDDARVIDYEDLLARAGDGGREFAVADENTAAALCYTSGTTGNPKGVLYSHRSVVLHASLLLMVDTFGISERDVIMPIVPMFHVNAWGLPYSAMLCGAGLVLPGPAMTPPELAGMLARHKVTFGAAVATIWRGLLPLLGQYDLSSVRQIVCGGGAVDEALTRAYQETIGLPLTNAWGMTETSPVVTTSRIATAHDGYAPGQQRALLGTPGPAVPLTEIRVICDDGREAPWDGRTPGELQASGPTIAARYFGTATDAATNAITDAATDAITDPATDAFTDDGWLRTGDVATIDRHGYVRIVDRTKDLVKSGGEWISSVELENAIMEHPDVVEAAVIGVADVKWGERPVACVVPVPGATLTAEAVRDHLRARVVSWWLPDQVFFLDEIPKTATGKFSKQRLRSRYAKEPSPWPSNHA